MLADRSDDSGTTGLPEQIPAASAELIPEPYHGERPVHRARPGRALLSFRAAGDGADALVGASARLAEPPETRADLVRALSAREQVMAIVAHDLRNPLSAIMTLTRLFSRQTGLPSNIVRGFAQVERAARRMDQLIQMLLDFAAARFGGALPISPVATDLGEVIRVVVEELQNVAPERSIHVEVAGCACGFWDPARMAQVVSNLVANALAHGLRHGVVEVSVQGAGSEVSFAVKNQGPVIPAEVCGTIFEPFQRGGAPNRDPRGLGLGLYIANQIVLAHGGRIEIASTAERGTIFTVHVPRAPPT
jgi:signal transduction histidine kinase